MKPSKYLPAKRYAHLTIGEGLRVLRELQEMTQAEVAAASGIPQAAISAIENDRMTLGLDRAKKLARALKVHPAAIAFPGWDIHAA
jgi:transcriptional regulator with XRE-family HTH domain